MKYFWLGGLIGLPLTCVIDGCVTEYRMYRLRRLKFGQILK